MYSLRSESSDRRPHNDKNSRQWGVYDDRVEGSDRNYRNDRTSYHRYDGDGHSRTKRVSRSSEYSDSPKRMYSKDSLNKDWSKKSPVRRCITSSDWRSNETKRQRFDKTYDDDRHRQDTEVTAFRPSPQEFSDINVSKDFRRTPPQKDDARYKKTPTDSRRRRLDEEFMYKQPFNDYRRLCPDHKERDRYERSWDRSQQRSQSQDCCKESHVKPRERNDGPYDDYEDQRDSRTRFLSNGSGEQPLNSDVTNLRSPSVPGQKVTKGFQRFLDVLNKGVNVAMLTKIVTQTSDGTTDRPPVSFPTSAEGMKSPVSAARQQGSHQSNSKWSECKETQRLPLPQAHVSFNPQMSSQSEESSEGGQSYLTSNSRSKSPSVVEKITLTPEDEHRHRQMQGVLQAIGMDLGFDELGQMSHRIQERLYGKKIEDWDHDHGGSAERDTRRTSSPSCQSRSSSNRSNMSPLTRDYLMKQDCYSDETDPIHLHQAGEFGQNNNSSSISSSTSLDNKKCESRSQESSAASEAFSPNASYIVSEAPVKPVLSTYCPYPPMTSALPPVPPNFRPQSPYGIPRLFLPHLTPVFRHPHMPHLNIIPAALNPTRHLLPQHISNSRLPLLNLPQPTQPLNATHKTKTLSRPRCLQVIETKQPG